VPRPEKLRGAGGCATHFHNRPIANIQRDFGSRLPGSTIKAYEIRKVQFTTLACHMWNEFSTLLFKLGSKFRLIFKAQIVPILEERMLRALSKKPSWIHW
jgi:hypothetical protein